MPTAIPRNMPTVPNSQPQNKSEIKIARVETPSPFPMIRGSSTFPIAVLITR